MVNFALKGRGKLTLLRGGSFVRDPTLSYGHVGKSPPLLKDSIYFHTLSRKLGYEVDYS